MTIIRKYRLLLLFLTFGGILREIFLFNPVSDLVILLLAGFWILSIWICKFKGIVSFGGGLICLALCPILLVFKTEMFAEKAAVWAFIFLVIGTIQIYIENLKEEKKGV